VAHEPRKKPLYFGDNPDHFTLALGLEYGCSYGWVWAPSYSAWEDMC